MTENIENKTPKDIKSKKVDYDYKGFKRPLIISSQKWNNVLKNLNKNEEAQKKYDEEQKYQEYLKKGSEEIKKTWPTKIVIKTTQEKIEEEQLKAKEKALKGNILSGLIFNY